MIKVVFDKDGELEVKSIKSIPRKCKWMTGVIDSRKERVGVNLNKK